MNKSLNQYVPLIGIGAVILAFAVVFFCTKDIITEYNESKEAITNYEREVQEKEREVSQIDALAEQEKLKLKSLKPVFETDLDSENENLGIYGDMFEKLVKGAQRNGLMIRSIEYNMTPETDPLLQEHADTYNACEVKFFFVGTYSQLQSFLSEVTNNFEYLVSISKLSVTAFSKNTDYLLINTSITMYSKKPESEIKRVAAENKRARRR